MSTEQADTSLIEFESYLDYVKSFLTNEDKRFLQCQRLERFIVKLGYRTGKSIYNENEFWARRNLVVEMMTGQIITGSILTEPLVTSDPVLSEFHKREVPNLLKSLATIVHVRQINPNGFEISAYIDLCESFNDFRARKGNYMNWIDIYAGRAKLQPKPGDLSYVDTHNKVITYKNSMNFIVMHDADNGVVFMHRGDHKIVPVGPKPKEHAESVVRSFEVSERYGCVVFYDHKVRKIA